MFGIGMPELILILVVGLVVIGPKKLPELARSLGRAIGEFKKATREFRETLDVEDNIREVREIKDEIKKTASETLKEIVELDDDDIPDRARYVDDASGDAGVASSGDRSGKKDDDDNPGA
ncbi:MAG: twin arginine-targeting protein translocase TatB [Desulfococcus sp. 4484_241]|nr:MAG: twin arginine-targeting protein translocase TatB [Desulfococcus sp. 4484_241]